MGGQTTSLSEVEVLPGFACGMSDTQQKGEGVRLRYRSMTHGSQHIDPQRGGTLGGHERVRPGTFLCRIIPGQQGTGS